MEDIKFSFGKNWSKYLKIAYTPRKLTTAIISLKEFLNIDNLKGKSFIDIGCGSGIFSLAAYRRGAKQILSFDIDPYSVNCCKSLKEKENNPPNWTVCMGSILDNEFISKLPKYDLVYSWGVLHHTGNMWLAIGNAGKLVTPGGYFYIAIYNKKSGLFGSGSWLKIKKAYNSLPAVGKRLIETGYIFAFFIHSLLLLHNPFKRIKAYSFRGMDWKRDVCDWLGGYPYEYATIEEIFRFCSKRGFELINIKSTNGLANNEFLFRRLFK